MLRPLLAVLAMASMAKAYKILVYSPTMSRSHMMSNGRVADTLALAGHNVTFWELDFTVAPKTIDVVRHAHYWPFTFEWPTRTRESRMEELLITRFYEDFAGFKAHLKHTENFCLTLLNQSIIEDVRAQQYDAIVYEQFDWCPIALAEMLGIRIKIWLSSSPLIEHQAVMLGVPLELAYVPAVINNRNSDQMGFIQRATNIVKAFMSVAVFHDSWSKAHTHLEAKLGRPFPNLWELASTADLTFINTDEVVDFPRPLPPSIIHIGGIGMDREKKNGKPLPANVADVMSKGKKGVVLFSLGSIAPTHVLPDGYVRNILHTFEKFTDYQFVVKLSKEDQRGRDIAKDIPNVYTSDWLPQASILAHKRLALFITHGGYNSIMEAAHHGVPLLAIGLFGDQPRNSKLVERNGWGLSLSKLSLLDGPEEFERDIRRILNDPKFKEGALRVQQLIDTKPMSGSQRLVSYVHYLEQNGGHLPELKTIAPQLSFIVYHNLDVFAAVLFASISTLLLVVWIVYRVTRLVIRPRSSTESGSKPKKE